MMPDNMSKRRLTKTALPVLLLLRSSLTPTVLADDASGAAYPLTTDSNCGCYRTNATTSNFFAHHQFFDFRSLTQYAVGSAPSPINAFDQSANAPPTSPYFSSSAWQGIWDIQTWNNSNVFKVNNSDLTGSDATIQMVNTPNNIYIERATDNSSPGAQTHLTMRTIRHSAFQSASEIESTSQGYQFLSVRMFARTTGATGAVTAMFTYRPPPNPTNLQLVQEADLEIRTRDPPTYVQYTNQPSWNSTSDIPQATRNVSIPGGKRWSDWTNFRMDWTPGSTTWYVNGQLASTIQFQAPRDPAQVIFNSWSDGGSWSGLMPVGQEAFLQIQWIEMVFNNTDPGQTKTGKCVNVCSIDDTSKTGQPVIITGNGGSSTPPSSGGGSSGSGSGGSSGGSSGGGKGGSGGSGGSSGGNSCQSAKYGQCGGKNWNGCKSCAAGTTCKFSNDYYSQCL